LGLDPKLSTTPSLRSRPIKSGPAERLAFGIVAPPAVDTLRESALLATERRRNECQTEQTEQCRES